MSHATRLDLTCAARRTARALEAVLFGQSTPLAQRLGTNISRFTTAALLYACRRGGGVVAPTRDTRSAAASRRPAAPIGHGRHRSGAGAGRADLGLQRANGRQRLADADAGGRFHGRPDQALVSRDIGPAPRRGRAAPVTGGVVVFEHGLVRQVQVLGVQAVTVANVTWGGNNTLSRGVADRDPGQVVGSRPCWALQPPCDLLAAG
jgi:hypothetical protein